jgi:ADP-ribosyl-[dinitrogen reductase] hydrolase
VDSTRRSLGSLRVATGVYGIGKSVRKFLRQSRVRRFTPWYHCGAESAGNGALMRIAPLVMLHPEGTSAALWLDTALASIVTHRDACSVASCVAFVDLLARLLRLSQRPGASGSPPRFSAPYGRCARTRPIAGAMATLHRPGTPFPRLPARVTCSAKPSDTRWNTRQACDAWYSGAYLLETVPSPAVDPGEQHAHDPEQAIVRAVNDTHDNDTVAAIVGAAVVRDARGQGITRSLADGAARTDHRGRRRTRVPVDRGGGPATLGLAPASPHCK